MGGYTKNVACLKGVKDGFSADGGALSGLVKAEKYGSLLRVNVSLINFAPLSGGRYVAVISDGVHAEIVEDRAFEADSPVDTSSGFSAAVFFVNGGVNLLAYAACGNVDCSAEELERTLLRSERIKGGEGAEGSQGDGVPTVTGILGGSGYGQDGGNYGESDGQYDGEYGARYNDGALAAENYYDGFEADEDGGAVRAGEEEKTGRQKPCPHEEDSRPLADSPRQGGEFAREYDRESACEGDREYTRESARARAKRRAVGKDGRDKDGGSGRGGGSCGSGKGGGNGRGSDCENGAADGLARGEFYQKMRAEIEGILRSYPADEELCALIPDSRWVKISYGDNFYVFGVICEQGAPAYICYGVPETDDKGGEGAEGSQKDDDGLVCFLEAGGRRYRVMYQDAQTGASIKLTGA